MKFQAIETGTVLTKEGVVNIRKGQFYDKECFEANKSMFADLGTVEVAENVTENIAKNVAENTDSNTNSNTQENPKIITAEEVDELLDLVKDEDEIELEESEEKVEI